MTTSQANWQRHFGLATSTWFEETFASPTPAQVAAWETLATDNNHALVLAPTGSGKTLAAFLLSLDRLSRTPSTGQVRVLYVSPLKALAVDIERNLQRPLTGIQQTAQRLGLPMPSIQVAVRSGDTTASERRRLVTKPPDILITTPESLFLMLSSQAKETLIGVETVIIDEIHSLAGTKRGAHLAVSLERLAAVNPQMQRIGLSATARPVTTIARFLGGVDRQVTVIDPPMPKEWTLDLRLPVDDLTNIAASPSATSDESANRHSIWPHVEKAILELILTHRSTICFVNSRMVAERLTARLNLAAEEYFNNSADHPIKADQEPTKQPQQYLSTYIASHKTVTLPDGATVVARAHHGSLSKEHRATIEADLKAGHLPAVVATSSLELGIDMGFVDLVIQVGSPPTVANGLQRIGRAGHQVGFTSHGVVFPVSRSDLVEATLVVKRMAAGQIEAVPSLSNPLDVLAQQIVSICLDAHHTSTAVFDLMRQSQPFTNLPREAYDAVLEMLSGRYPSEDFAELRPRLTWDRQSDQLVARPGSRQLVTTSGGTIPDRGLFGVFLSGDSEEKSASRRVGELDEIMVRESRVGDVVTLGSSSWRIEAITPHQVQVTPAPGRTSRLPFWLGDSQSRPIELGLALGAFISEIDQLEAVEAEEELKSIGLDDRARANFLGYLADQQRAAGVLPSDKTIVIERFRDDLGDWRICLHAPFGLSVLRPWMLAVQKKLVDVHGLDVRVSVRNDGVIWHFPDSDAAPPSADLLLIPPDDLTDLVTQSLFGSALFAAHFRECAARALLLPRRQPGTRTPLWQQRLRSARLLQVAAGYQGFPIIMEAVRECLDDVFDLPALRKLQEDITAQRIALVEVETDQPSPFAQSLLFGYSGEFVYDDDQPLAERRNAAWSIDPSLLSSLLGQSQPTAALDAAIVEDVEAGLQRLRHPTTTAEALWDMLRQIGPLTEDECQSRCLDSSAWLAELADDRRIIKLTLPSGQYWALVDDQVLITEADSGDQAARLRLTTRWLNCHVIVEPEDLAKRYGWPSSDCCDLLDELVSTGQVRCDSFDSSSTRHQYASLTAIKQVARRQAAILRAATRPVSGDHLANFLSDWQGIKSHESGTEAVLKAVEQLAGWPLPASMLESLVLPARVANYHPNLLDEVLSSGQVTWTGAGSIGQRDGWVMLWPSDMVLVEPGAEAGDDPLTAAIWQRLAAGGAWRVTDLGSEVAATQAALWRLAWDGLVTSDTFIPVRDLARKGALRSPRSPRPHRAGPHRIGLGRAASVFQPAFSGRWSKVEPTINDPTRRWAEIIGCQLSRHGILTRGSVLAEALTPSYTPAYQVLSAMEDKGLIRRGYFVEGAGASQFALPGTVDRLRIQPDQQAILLAACDPANPYGTAIDWPPSLGHHPSRRAGAMVVLWLGKPICYLERGAKTLLTFAETSAEALLVGLQTIGQAVDAGRIETVSITKINFQAALTGETEAASLRAAGFQPTPQGFVRRPQAA